MISSIDPDICVGCQLCIGLCAYSAIEYNPYAGISEVNSAVCKGCGACAGACPSGAPKVKHFTDKQIFAEIDGILLEDLVRSPVHPSIPQGERSIKTVSA